MATVAAHQPAGVTGPNLWHSKATSLRDMTKEDAAIMDEQFPKIAGTRQRVQELLGQLRAMKGKNIGASVDLYEHSLQTTSKAFHAGEDEETVVAALLHDIGEILVPLSHGEVASALLRPFVSARVDWMLNHHEMWQFKHYGHAYDVEDVDGPARPFEAHEHAHYCARFCMDYDQAGFDPKYESLAIELFEPMLERVLARPTYWDPATTAKCAMSHGKSQITAAYPTKGSEGADTLQQLLVDEASVAAPPPPATRAVDFLTAPSELPAPAPPWGNGFRAQTVEYARLAAAEPAALATFLRAMFADGLCLVTRPSSSSEDGKKRKRGDQGCEAGALRDALLSATSPEGRSPPETPGKERVKVFSGGDTLQFVDGHMAASQLTAEERDSLAAKGALLGFDGDGRLKVTWQSTTGVTRREKELRATLTKVETLVTKGDSAVEIEAPADTLVVCDSWRVLQVGANWPVADKCDAEVSDLTLRAVWRKLCLGV